MYTITLNDGSKIEKLKMRLNSLWSDTELTEAMFRGKLAPVTITGTKDDGEDEDYGRLAGTHDHMDIAFIRHFDEGYQLALYDIPEEKFRDAKRDADIAYLAMMLDIDL